MKMVKHIKIDTRAAKEISDFSENVQIKITASLEILARDGFLKEPYTKRINNNLFEIRVKYKGQWRALYAYLKKEFIIILSAFHKKTQKTPTREIKKAEKRLQEYKGGDNENK
jgi:phage-related protein